VSAVSDRITELLEALVAIPTHETEDEAQALVAAWLDACGFTCTLEDVLSGRPNLVAVRGDGGPLLCSHIDVHPPHAHPDPFVCRRDGDDFVGRGVLDAKGQIAALIDACERSPKTAALVAITCDEERGGLGSERLALPDGPWLHDGGIVLEPTGLRVCTAQSGHIDVSIRVTATPMHAYAPDPAGSPISAVLAAADALETCSFLTTRHPLLPPPRVHLGRIDGGEHLWRRPAAARAEIGLGLVPGVDAAAAADEIRSRLDDLGRRWAARGASFRYEIVDESAAIEIPADLPISSHLARVLRAPLDVAGMPSWTDAGNLLVHHNVPCVIFGAGALDTAHSDRESVRASDLVRLSDVLVALLEGYG
jgi:acetylornithine deacetylase/succinyl-diaminopimelate desuccinylase-like protein